MNGLIKQLFIPNFPAAQLAEHKTEDLRRTSWPGFLLGLELFPVVHSKLLSNFEIFIDQ